jgi:phenylalanine-4-hydroxylase
MHTQQYASYSDTDHSVWSILFNRQFSAVQQHAYANFFPGLNALNFNAQKIPDFDQINQRLLPLTGWTVYAVPGLIDNSYFFEQMHGRKFGATTWIRKPEQLDYLEEPDMFHDVFGHIPLLTDSPITEYLFGLAAIATRYPRNEAVVEAISRLYWYTIEFGLIMEKDVLKIYGAGILSSIGETAYCLSGKPRLEKFDVAKIIDTPYIKETFQEQYFVLSSLKELKAALPELEILCGSMAASAA